MKPVYLLLFQLFILEFSAIPTAFADQKDTLNIKVLISQHQQYNSELERTILNSTDSVTWSMLDFMLAGESDLTENQMQRIRSDMDTFIKALSQEVEKMSFSFKIRHIFKRTHNQYLKKYDEQVTFYNIFQSGYYNCVTGTSLFAHVLNELKIPYQVKELPDHVYLIVDPDKFNIPLESTNPKTGFYKPSTSFMNKYIDMMLEYKLITYGELDSNGIETTFNKYYYSRTNINYRELVGLQYYNIGLFNYNLSLYTGTNQAIGNTIINAEKAFCFNNSERIRFLMFMAYSNNLFTTAYYADTNTIGTLIKLYCVSPVKSRTKLVRAEYNRMKEEVLLGRSDQRLFEYYYNRFALSFKADSALTEWFKMDFLFESARNSLFQNDFESSLKYIFAASSIDPNNREYIGVAELAITKKTALLPTPDQRITALNRITQTYKHLRENRTIKLLYSYNYLEQARLYNGDCHYTEARFSLEKFEKIRETKGIDTTYIAAVYVDLSKCLEKVRNYPLAKQCIDRGLSVLPYNQSLTARRKEVLLLH
ncbi:MAG: hypothetical protein WC760_09280 [Bacteroidia bacterium]|jgi:hypothetical protein